MRIEKSIWTYWEKALKRIDDYAGQKNVTVLLEATNRYENNVLNTGARSRT